MKTKKIDPTRNVRITRHRVKLYEDTSAHTIFKAKDAARKRQKRALAPPHSPAKLEAKRAAACERQRKSRDARKVEKTRPCGLDLVKNALWRQKRRLEKASKSCPTKSKWYTSTPITSTPQTPRSPDSAAASASTSSASTSQRASVMWKHLTPRSRKKLKHNISSESSDPGLNRQFWRELGLVNSSQAEFDELISKIEEVGGKHKDASAMYNEWTKVPNPLSPKGSKISRKNAEACSSTKPVL